MIGLITPARLRELGIVGMNERNITLIGKNNSRKNYKFVDNKLLTKKIALERGDIPVPELYGTVEYLFQMRSFLESLDARDSFVLKPAQGSGGKGILVISGREGDAYIKASGDRVDRSFIRHHIINTLAGLYSLGGRNDCVMAEGLIDFDESLKRFSFEGLPDVRVIVYEGVPLMAMMRCATEQSDGKANLHQGAVGVGLDLASGGFVCAVQHGELVDVHPDTGARFCDLSVPHWDGVLELAASCNRLTGLGYIGADIVLDKKQGPMLLELNARPGLSIQVANQSGLLQRIKGAREIVEQTDEAALRVSLAKERFGNPGVA